MSLKPQTELQVPVDFKHDLLLRFGVIIEGGRCLNILKTLDAAKMKRRRVKLLYLVITRNRADCLHLATEKGIKILDDPQELLAQPSLDFIMEMTGDSQLLAELAKRKPNSVGLMDCNTAQLFLDMLRRQPPSESQDSEISLATSFASALLEASPDAVMVIDRNYRILNCNDSELITKGKGRDSIIGRHCFEAIHGALQPCSQKNRDCPMDRAIESGRPARAVHEVQLPDGSTRISQVTTYPLVNHEGEIIQVVDVIRDITQDVSQRIEARARAIKEDLNRFVQEDRLVTLGRLVASVCHEINNPITSIVTFNKLILSYIREDKLPPEGLKAFERYLEMSVREALRSGTIVNNLLTFARQKGVESGSVDLREMVDTILMLMGHQMDKIELQRQVRLPSAPFCAFGDYAQIQQVLMNLISNAIEAMPEGGTLDIEGGHESGGNRIWIKVCDTGCGIAETDLPHIFEPFYSTKNNGRGVGLGLSMVYGITREHNGTVEVDSQVDRGTCFKITLPSGPSEARGANGDTVT
jgi:PAS domain S-box-containing protein